MIRLLHMPWGKVLVLNHKLGECGDFGFRNCNQENSVSSIELMKEKSKAEVGPCAGQLCSSVSQALRCTLQHFGHCRDDVH